MKRHPGIHRLAPALAWLLAAAVPLLADSNLDVQCVDAAGGGVSAAKVLLQHLNTGKWREGKSDGKGKASFKKLDDGVYRVVARKEGFEPGLHEFLTLKGSAEQNITVQLKAGDVAKKLYFESQADQQKAIDLLNQGIQSLQSAKFAEAKKQLEESLAIYPSNPDAQYNLAIVYLEEQKWPDAEAALKKTAALADVFSELPTAPGASGSNPYKELRQRVDMVLSKMGSLKVRGEADRALRARRFDEAIAKYRELLALEKDPDTYYNLAVAQAQTRKYDDALASLEEALKVKASEKQYLDLKKQIIDIKQNEVLIKAQGVLDQGNKLFEQGDYAGALAKYEEVRAGIPEKNQAGVWYQIARAQGQLKQPDKAIEAYRKAMALAPEKADYRKALAQYYLDEKRYEEALDLYAEPGAGSESPDQAVFALGQKLSTQGNSEVAQVAFEKVLKLNPQHPEAQYELGMSLYYGKKNDRRAKELLTKYLETGKVKDHVDNARTVLVVLNRRMATKK